MNSCDTTTVVVHTVHALSCCACDPCQVLVLVHAHSAVHVHVYVVIDT